MRNTSLFIAMSLDGYIADKQGGVDWLGGEESTADDMASYLSFIENIDTVVMGWNTYRQITMELSQEDWPYAEMDTYVVTHQKATPMEGVTFVNEDPCELIDRLQQEAGNGIWICGGANIAQQLIQENKIDIFHISVIPILLGEGIRLFKDGQPTLPLKLIETQSYNGIVDLVYEHR